MNSTPSEAQGFFGCGKSHSASHLSYLSPILPFFLWLLLLKLTIIVVVICRFKCKEREQAARRIADVVGGCFLSDVHHHVMEAVVVDHW